MLDFVKDFLLKHNIDLVGAIKLSECRLTRPYKLKSFKEDEHPSLSVIVFAIPYLARYDEKNISAYSVPRDYHLFSKELFEELGAELRKDYPASRFECFADNSPIDERHAAALCGLGLLGDNGLLITQKYSSYVFLGEIVTDYPISSEAKEIKHCIKCGKCRLACPMEKIGECLSALTQKKGELTQIEEISIKKHGSAWGCDICQEVCPYTLHAKRSGTIYTSIEFFKSSLSPILDSKTIMAMSDSEFLERAYSWRGRDVIMRNINILENNQKNEEN